MKLIKALFQIGLMGVASVFFYYGYIHLEGNYRFMESLENAKSSMEARSIGARIRPTFPGIESIFSVAGSADGPFHTFQFKQKGKTPLLVTHTLRKMVCASCKDIDLYVVTDLRGVIKKIQLGNPLEVEGKPIDSTTFIQQFEGKKFTSPIIIGKDIQELKESAVYTHEIVDAVSDVLGQIRSIVHKG